MMRRARMAVLCVLAVVLPMAAPASALADVADYTVEYPREPLLLGTWFDVVVKGPDLQSLRVGVEDHVGDVLLGPPTRAARDADGESGPVELRRPLCIARQGDYSLPLAVVDAAGESIDLAPLELSVFLDVPDGHRNRVSDLLGAIPVPVPATLVWEFFAATVLLMGALFAWIVVETRERVVVVHEPPADQVAIAALERLRMHLPRTRDEVLPFVIDVSDVLRRYIEQMFSIHAPAQTTEEFLAEATERHDSVSERRTMLEDFLTQCDLVKYARQRPAPAAAEPLVDTVEGFVEETRS